MLQPWATVETLIPRPPPLVGLHWQCIVGVACIERSTSTRGSALLSVEDWHGFAPQAACASGHGTVRWRLSAL